MPDTSRITAAILHCAFAAVLFSAVGCAVAQEDSVAPSPAGKVELTEGDVRLYDSANNMRTIKTGDMVNEGDTIVTGKDGELHLDLEDGGFIAVRPNTRMRIVNFRAQGDDDDKGIFSLLEGSFRSVTGWIGKFKPSAYQIRTPTATIGIRGTDHEPLVIPPGASEGEPGTYDKVNAGGSYIESTQGRIDVPPGKSAFASHSPKPGQAMPHLLPEIPRFFRPTRNEHLIEKRHELIQQRIGHLREERRKQVLQHRTSLGKTHPAVLSSANPSEKHQQRQEARNKRIQKLKQRKEARRSQNPERKYPQKKGLLHPKRKQGKTENKPH